MLSTFKKQISFSFHSSYSFIQNISYFITIIKKGESVADATKLP